MTGLAVLAIVALASWVLRIAFVVLIPVRELPPAVLASLDVLAPAVLTSIVVVDVAALLTHDANPAGAAETLAATLVIGVVAWRTRSLVITAALAMMAVAALDLVVR